MCTNVYSMCLYIERFSFSQCSLIPSHINCMLEGCQLHSLQDIVVFAMLFNWLTVAAAAQTESLTRTHIRTPIIGQFHFDSLVCVWDLHPLGWTRNYGSLLWRTLRARPSTPCPGQWDLMWVCQISASFVVDSRPGLNGSSRTAKLLIFRVKFFTLATWLSSHAQLRHAAGCLLFRIEIEFRCAALPCKCSPTHSDWQSGIHEALFLFELIKGKYLCAMNAIYIDSNSQFFFWYFSQFLPLIIFAPCQPGNGQPETGSSPQKRLNCTRSSMRLFLLQRKSCGVQSIYR